MQCPELRVALSLPLVKLTVQMAALHRVNAAMAQRKQDWDITMAWWAIFYLLLQHWFRADTMGAIQNNLQPDGSWKRDIVRRQDGSRAFLVRSLKGVTLLHPFWREIPAPLATSKVRLAVELVIDAGLETVDPRTGEPLIGPFLLGDSSSKAATRISGAMSRMITGVGSTALSVIIAGESVQPASFLPPGTFIASHSWRKSGASAYAASPRGEWNSILKWGGWASAKNAERYVDRRFTHDPVTHDFWDWLFAGSYQFDWYDELPKHVLSLDSDDGTFDMTG
jgi:hypothetical protein